MNVRYSLNATAELSEIFSYIARENPAAARTVVERVEQVVARLALFPGSARLSDVAGVRVAPLVRFPYSIYYKVDAGELLILHIRHGARRPPAFHEQPQPFVL
ncbi:MAG: type II toxin-antitoxin system RelE/ParE family toxin [Alphaproteobacteria bacterium]|nr:type II toxin-antitoxin system RelE/ParE family toxin [Alphaproteobacteria bacterium]